MWIYARRVASASRPSFPNYPIFRVPLYASHPPDYMEIRLQMAESYLYILRVDMTTDIRGEINNGYVIDTFLLS